MTSEEILQSYLLLNNTTQAESLLLLIQGDSDYNKTELSLITLLQL